MTREEEAQAWRRRSEPASQPDIVPELVAWLKRRASDATLPAIEQAAYINVLNKIEQMKGQQ